MKTKEDNVKVAYQTAVKKAMARIGENGWYFVGSDIRRALVAQEILAQLAMINRMMLADNGFNSLPDFLDGMYSHLNDEFPYES